MRARLPEVPCEPLRQRVHAPLPVRPAHRTHERVGAERHGHQRHKRVQGALRPEPGQAHPALRAARGKRGEVEQAQPRRRPVRKPIELPQHVRQPRKCMLRRCNVLQRIVRPAGLHLARRRPRRRRRRRCRRREAHVLCRDQLRLGRSGPRRPAGAALGHRTEERLECAGLHLGVVQHRALPVRIPGSVHLGALDKPALHRMPLRLGPRRLVAEIARTRRTLVLR